MNLIEIIDDTLISYSKRDIDLEQARDIILMEINTLLKEKLSYLNDDTICYETHDLYKDIKELIKSEFALHENTGVNIQ